ncbi:MAG: sulfotransferase [Parvularculaceae bacterium]|nr:sulfotransferase [Parvularculaceae bacterium]
MAPAGLNNQRVKVVYIAGYGRSGTTLLSIALEQHSAIFSAGEIHELTRHAWTENTFCSCGEHLQACAFWAGVMQRWLPPEQVEFLGAYVSAQKRFEPMAYSRVGVRESEAFGDFAVTTAALLREIASAAGKNVIVDSSKMPGRAWALAQMDLIDLYVIHLVRDGRGVAWSLSKSYARDVKAGLQREIKPKSALRTSLRWSMVNLAAEGLRRVVGMERYLRVRYEDFVAEPLPVMTKIGEMIGVDLTASGAQLAAGEGMRAGHQIAGNRLRLNPSIKLEVDQSWRSEMPAAKRRLFETSSGWLLNRYDYS